MLVSARPAASSYVTPETVKDGAGVVNLLNIMETVGRQNAGRTALYGLKRERDCGRRLWGMRNIAKFTGGSPNMSVS